MRKLHWVSMALVSLPLALVACGGDDTTTTGTAGSAGAAGSGGSGGGAAGTAGTTGGSGGGGAGTTTEGGAGTAVLEAGVLEGGDAAVTLDATLDGALPDAVGQ